MNVYVGNLPFATTEAELRERASPYGEIASCMIVIDRETGRSRGFGFVEMPDQDEAVAMIEGLNGSTLGGRVLTVTKARPPRRASGDLPEGQRPVAPYDSEGFYDDADHGPDDYADVYGYYHSDDYQD